MENNKTEIKHTLIVSGKVKDVQAQLEMMSKQFPNATIKEVLDSYGVQELILQ